MLLVLAVVSSALAQQFSSFISAFAGPWANQTDLSRDGKRTYTLRSRSHCTVVLTDWFELPGYRCIVTSQSKS